MPYFSIFLSPIPLTDFISTRVKLENLAKDLMRLSLTSPEAKEIVTQFNIQMNQPAVPPATPAK